MLLGLRTCARIVLLVTVSFWGLLALGVFASLVFPVWIDLPIDAVLLFLGAMASYVLFDYLWPVWIVLVVVSVIPVGKKSRDEGR